VGSRERRTKSKPTLSCEKKSPPDLEKWARWVAGVEHFYSVWGERDGKRPKEEIRFPVTYKWKRVSREDIDSLLLTGEVKGCSVRYHDQGKLSLAVL